MKSQNEQIAFTIAGIEILLNLENSITVTENFEPFISEGTTRDKIEIDFKEQDCIDFGKAAPLFSNLIFSVYKDEEGYYRVFHDHKENDRPYAIGRIKSETKEEICYLKDRAEFFCESQNSFSHIALEELLLKRNAMILHAAFVNTSYDGILFSGPSGIGKSTQADLWVKYANAKLINGDRPILRNEKGVWKAYGSPYAGSSQCFKNESAKVRGIVILEQAEACRVERLDMVSAFCKVYAGMIVNTWNPDYVKKISELTEQLVKSVPVYRFFCNQDKEAVTILSNFIKREAKDEKE